MRVKLTNNKDETRNHASILSKELATADHFTCIVAFARESGLEMILTSLKTRIAKGMTATFVVGIDFFQTEPALLKKLLRLKSSAKSTDGVSIYMGAEKHQRAMHPKVYLFARKDGSTVAVVGSANMTGGGFQANHEFSAIMSGRDVSWGADLQEWIDVQIEAGELVKADDATIERYAARRAAYLPHVQMAEDRARKAIERPPGNLDTLREILVTMRADKSGNGFDAQVKRRRVDHRQAHRVLMQLAQPGDLPENRFLELYEKLVSGLWKSGGLHRGKTMIAQNAGRFQGALRMLNSNKSNNPNVLFGRLRQAMIKVPGAGINVITEILHTRDRKKFPVMNQNSVSGMKRALITGYPDAPAKESVSGATYASFCADADSIRSGLGLTDFSELDALFNYAYWGHN